MENVEEPRVNRRDLALSAVLLVAAVLTGATSLMPWRDFGGRSVSASETGWERLDGSLGRGWLTVLVAVVLAVAGVLVAADRVRQGRILASATGSFLVVLAIAEWGLGLSGIRSGPGVGLWLQMAIGVAVVVAVGVLGPKKPSPSPW